MDQNSVSASQYSLFRFPMTKPKPASTAASGGKRKDTFEVPVNHPKGKRSSTSFAVPPEGADGIRRQIVDGPSTASAVHFLQRMTSGGGAEDDGSPRPHDPPQRNLILSLGNQGIATFDSAGDYGLQMQQDPFQKAPTKFDGARDALQNYSEPRPKFGEVRTEMEILMLDLAAARKNAEDFEENLNAEIRSHNEDLLDLQNFVELVKTYVPNPPEQLVEAMQFLNRKRRI